ncbi:hypothetical protein [Paenibacillus gansuensis]|uniref:Glycerophosphoryl diester phosphodiesterase membrane domain-containing protein n=1 Tax=Paenibacillus gansuensis TaxID=306542 RepID=A0ABW5P7G7_9BACL
MNDLQTHTLNSRPESLGVISLLRETLQFCVRHIGPLLFILFSVAIPWELLDYLFLNEGSDISKWGIKTAVSVILGMVVQSFTTAAVIAYMYRVLLQKSSITMVQAYWLSYPYGLWLFGYTLLVIAATGLGLLFLLVPGIFFLARFALYQCVIMFEGTEKNPLSRSNALVKGHTWGILASLVLLIMLAMALQWVFQQTMGIPLLELPLLWMFVYNLAAHVIFTISTVWTVLAYIRLRNMEHPQAEIVLA